MTAHRLYEAPSPSKEERLGAYLALLRTELDEEELDAIRANTNKRLLLGNERFAAEVQAA